MRIAFAVSGRRNAADAIQVARVVEDRGINDLWITEDYCERGAFALAGALLAATTQLTVGIGVVNPWTRHPMLTAMEAACLHEIGPGRLLLGLGASNAHWMGDQLGISFEKPLSRLRESVEIIRTALSGEYVRHEGHAGSVDTKLDFTPQPLPIILGVKGPKALRMSGEIADGVLLSVLSSPQYVRWAASLARTRRRLPLASYVAIQVDDDRLLARQRMRPFVAKFLGVHGVHPITELAGIDAYRAQQFRQGWQAGQPREDLVTDEVLDAVSIAGDRDDLAAGLRRFADAGLDTAIINDQPSCDPGDLLDKVQDAARDAESLSSGRDDAS
jgi:5,10-methylenetetrahydromethanopterin reductase